MSTWSDMMTDTVTIASPTGSRDDWGERSAGSTSEIDCRLEYDTAVVRGGDGSVEEYAHRFSTYTAVDEETLVWLPGANTANKDEAFKPRNVERASLDGETLYVVTL